MNCRPLLHQLSDTPLPEYCFFYGRRRVTVARYRMICLVFAIDAVFFPTIIKHKT